jgi:uncharacterized protein (TIGR02145 family)
MKFFVIRDAKGNIEKLEDVVAGRVFYSCNNSIGGITNSNDDGSKYWWNQEKQSVDGKIVIGTQIWSDKNLNTDKFRNGDLIPEAKTNEEWIKYLEQKKPAWCYYQNNPENGAKYGKLYNRYALEDTRNIAPVGWRIPSGEDWYRLIFIKFGNNGLRAGNSMKARVDWAESANPSETKFSNTSGFSALPAGYRNSNGSFEGIKYYGVWWSASKYIKLPPANESWLPKEQLIGDNIGVSYNMHGASVFQSLDLNAGLSIRLIQENSFKNIDKDLIFELVLPNLRYELSLLSDEANTSKLKIYKDGTLIKNIEGNWKVELNPGVEDKIIMSFLEQTSGGYEKSYKTVNYPWVCNYNDSKDIISLKNGDGTWYISSSKQIDNSKNNSFDKKNDTNFDSNVIMTFKPVVDVKQGVQLGGLIFNENYKLEVNSLLTSDKLEGKSFKAEFIKKTLIGKEKIKKGIWSFSKSTQTLEFKFDDGEKVSFIVTLIKDGYIYQFKDSDGKIFSLNKVDKK